MSVEISAPARASIGNVINPRANEAREQVFSAQVMDWVLRGWVFSLGLLVDDTTNIVAMTTLADTTPLVSLQSPAGGDTIVVPILAGMYITEEDGGGLSQLDIAYTKAAEECATNLTLSGTAMTGVINHLTTYPSKRTKCTVLSTVTASALTVVDSIVLAHKEIANAILTAATFMVDPKLEYDFSKAPIALIEGGALLLYAYTATTGAEIRPSITWAEIPADKYLP